jgi:signal transduction histidine kinase
VIAPERRLAIALVATGALVVAGVATRLARAPIAGEAAVALLPLLLAIAAVLAAVLMRGRATSLAWPVAAAGAILAVREPVALAAAVQGSGTSADVWVPPAALVALTAAVSCGIAALYATRDPEAPRWLRLAAWTLVVWQAVGACLSIGIGLAGRPDDPAGPSPLHVLTIPVGYWPLVPLILLVTGALADLRGPLRRARTGRERVVGPADLPGVAGALGDELLGRAASRRTTERRERARLASELHAEVLPALRAALADLEAGRDAALVGGQLAAIATDIQALTLDRRNLILEELGLVAALEALAERFEERGIATIDIDVGEPASAAPTTLDHEDGGRPPLAVERAALHVAELALANAARHGSGPVRVGIVVDAHAVHLEIANDGPPFDPEVARDAVRRGARGLSEMREAAAEIDADLDVRPGPAGGAIVRLTWPP